MKTITVTEGDYATLMELSGQLQLQENDSQAFPYFWGPMSTKSGIGTEDDEPLLYDSHAAETISLENYAEENSEVFRSFLKQEEYPADAEYSDINDEYEWGLFACERNSDLSMVFTREEQVFEPNFSLFKSDVKEFISGNGHRLGGDPHTYARTFFRMRRMEALVKVLYRLNPQAEEDINEEALYYRNSK